MIVVVCRIWEMWFEWKHTASLEDQGGIRGTVVALWTWPTGREIDPAQGHDSKQNSSPSPRFSTAQYSLNRQNRGLKHHSII